MGAMTVRGGRLEFLVPHLLRSQLLRPGFVRLSLRLGAARQMPAWAKLQFLNAGISAADLDRVLGRVTSLESWVEEWERLASHHEEAGRAALAQGRPAEAARRLVSASAAYNFAQYVMFVDVDHKRALHEACTRAYVAAAPLLDPPARLLEVPFRRQLVKGWLRVPRGNRPAPVVALFHGTNGVKEDLHGWTEALLERGLATLAFDGPGLGETFHRLSMVAEPRPVWSAIFGAIQAEPALDPARVGLLGTSLGAFLAVRMAAHDPRVRAVAAVSPPHSISIYWNVTLYGMRRELAALYGTTEGEMSAVVERMTLAGVLPALRTPLLVAGGGHDLITPGEEALRIFDEARCERQLIYYPAGAHDCFNVLADLRPRVASWFVDHLRAPLGGRQARSLVALEPGAWGAAEAVDPDFAEELSGDGARRIWNCVPTPAEPARWTMWPGAPPRGRADRDRVEVVCRSAAAGEARDTLHGDVRN
jgi:2,6-dihydroxypseudooxynicotine hydrolase